MRKIIFLTLMMIVGMSSIFFISPVFGGSYILSCSFHDEILPIKFKFSEDKKTSWILLKLGIESEDKWVKLNTKQTEEYYFLTGLVQIENCYTKKSDYKDYNISFVYIIDRSSLRLYKKVIGDQETPKFCDRQKTWEDGKTLLTFKNPCTVSNIKF